MGSGTQPLKTVPSLELESRLMACGHALVAGIDEAGRGPLAGPVVAAAVILEAKAMPKGLNDSKLLLPEVRDLGLRHTLFFAEPVIGARLLNRVEILALDILDQCKRHDLAVIEIAD